MKGPESRLIGGRFALFLFWAGVGGSYWFPGCQFSGLPVCRVASLPGYRLAKLPVSGEPVSGYDSLNGCRKNMMRLTSPVYSVY